MANDPNDPAIYGPVNGQFVTLSTYQAWQAAEYARNQAESAAAFNQSNRDLGLNFPNPFVVPPPPPPPPPPPVTPPVGGGAPKSHVFGDPGSYCDLFFDDPLCQIWSGGPGGGIVIGGGGTTIEQPIIIYEGLNATDVNNIVDNGLNAVWNATISEVDAALAALVSGVQQALTSVGNAVKASWAILARLSGFILNFLIGLVQSLISGVLKVLQDIRGALRDLYDKVLVPLVGAIGRLRERLLDLYKKFIRPLLIVMQDIRRVLRILAAFHIPFAAKLDAKIAGLERRLTAPLFYLLGYVNSVANWVNLIVTARYLLQKPLFLNSLNAYAGEALNLQIGAMIRKPDQTAVSKAAQNAALPTTQDSEGAFTAYLSQDGGSHAELAAQSTAQLQSTLGMAA